MNIGNRNVKALNQNRPSARAIVLAVLLVVTSGSLASLGAAGNEPASPPISIAQLAGPWQITIVGNTGCGLSSTLVDVTLNSAGTGTGSMTGHSGCGDSTTSQTFTINSLNANGSGTAGLSCGPGCGFNFDIQVSPSRTVFNLVDVTDPSQYLAGTGIKQ